MTNKPQTKWIINLKSKTGQLRTEIFHFQPKVGQVMRDGSVVIGVS
jgi:hypothetical protein